MPDELQPRLDLALRAAREAGDITLEYFRRDDLRVERKGDNSPVTVADREAERRLRERIAAEFPDDAILGEEFGEQAGTSGYRWILDPIDGTQSFVHGVPLYGTLVGVEADGEPVAGVIHAAAEGETLWAGKGQGAWHARGDGAAKPARVSACDRLREATLLTSELEGFGVTGTWPVIQALQSAVRVGRTWGDCYGYLMVATGRADAMIDPRMHVWDAAALLPILEEAGGTFTDWQGRRTIHGGVGLATNGALSDAVLETIATARV